MVNCERDDFARDAQHHIPYTMDHHPHPNHYPADNHHALHRETFDDHSRFHGNKMEEQDEPEDLSLPKAMSQYPADVKALPQYPAVPFSPIRAHMDSKACGSLKSRPYYR